MRSSRMRTARLCIVPGGGREVLSGGTGRRCCPGGGRCCDMVPGGREVLSRGEVLWPGPGGGRCCPGGEVLSRGKGGVVQGGGRCCDLVWPGGVVQEGRCCDLMSRGEGGRCFALSLPLTMWPTPWCIWCNTPPPPPPPPPPLLVTEWQTPVKT